MTRDDLKTALGIVSSGLDKNKEIVDDTVVALLKKISAILSLKSSGKMTAVDFATELDAIDLDKAVNALNWLIDTETTVRAKDLDASVSASLKKLQSRPVVLAMIAEFFL